MSIDLTLLKTLREQTGVSFSVCKKALEDAGGDIEKAKKLLTKWGEKKAADKAERVADQGVIGSYIHHTKRVAALVELRTETDFVAKNDEFQKLAQEIAMQVATMNPENVEELLKQEYIRDASKSIGDLLKDAILKFGENTKIHRITRWELGRE
ncbi:MAG TPA: translation elongation factor Ts [Candidatus Woesebacteria bacterium]|nr:translation elongation factor Ts [Candidatus Woesebacteria bacterium]HNS94421.1 translation elongation factor Ts [Candidatus Woesebacteria bacterium]